MIVRGVAGEEVELRENGIVQNRDKGLLGRTNNPRLPGRTPTTMLENNSYWWQTDRNP